ncbi:MAG: hypothetical protein IKQ41_10495, partial [Clostridia bacterium]|nr:hypothetical protein [Clostridia bacterium]
CLPAKLLRQVCIPVTPFPKILSQFPFLPAFHFIPPPAKSQMILFDRGALFLLHQFLKAPEWN